MVLQAYSPASFVEVPSFLGIHATLRAHLVCPRVPQRRALSNLFDWIRVDGHITVCINLCSTPPLNHPLRPPNHSSGPDLIRCVSTSQQGVIRHSLLRVDKDATLISNDPLFRCARTLWHHEATRGYIIQVIVLCRLLLRVGKPATPGLLDKKEWLRFIEKWVAHARHNPGASTWPQLELRVATAALHKLSRD